MPLFCPYLILERKQPYVLAFFNVQFNNFTDFTEIMMYNFLMNLILELRMLTVILTNLKLSFQVPLQYLLFIIRFGYCQAVNKTKHKSLFLFFLCVGIGVCVERGRYTAS